MSRAHSDLLKICQSFVGQIRDIGFTKLLIQGGDIVLYIRIIHNDTIVKLLEHLPANTVCSLRCHVESAFHKSSINYSARFNFKGEG